MLDIPHDLLPVAQYVLVGRRGDEELPENIIGRLGGDLGYQLIEIQVAQLLTVDRMLGTGAIAGEQHAGNPAVRDCRT